MKLFYDLSPRSLCVEVGARACVCKSDAHAQVTSFTDVKDFTMKCWLPLCLHIYVLSFLKTYIILLYTFNTVFCTKHPL